MSACDVCSGTDAAGLPDETEALLWAPWRMLETDHGSFLEELHKLDDLSKQFRARPPSRAQARKRIVKIYDHFEDRMSRHFRAEEKAVFPYLRHHAPRLKPALEDLTFEHHQIRKTMTSWKQTVKRSRVSSSAADDMDSLFGPGQELSRLLRAHVLKERRIMGKFSPR